MSIKYFPADVKRGCPRKLDHGRDVGKVEIRAHNQIVSVSNAV